MKAGFRKCAFCYSIREL